MYQSTPLQQLYAQLDLAITDNLQRPGFGQFRLTFQPNCGNARQIRLENMVHQGFELNGRDVKRLTQHCLEGAQVNPAFLPIWQPLHCRLEAILGGEGYGSLVVSFGRIKNDRLATVTIEGGKSERVCLPVDFAWL